MLRLVAPLLAIALAVAAVVWSDRPAPPADYTYIDASPSFTLDPQRMSYEQDFRFGLALYDGLLRNDPYTFEVMPSAAERWEVSEDLRTYTFHLREGLRWSNGDPLTAGDFVRSWRRAILPDTAADYTKLFFTIDGAEEFFRFRADQLAAYAARPAREKSAEAARALREEAERAFAEMVGLAAPDDRTLVVRLVRPTPYFLDLCAFVCFSPVHTPTVERWVMLDPSSGRIEQQHGWTKPPRLISSGPYILTEWRFKRDMRFERNPYYWNTAAVRSDSVRVLSIEDPNTRVLAYETGAADWTTDVTANYIGDMVERSRGLEKPLVHGFNRFGTYFWSFNCTPTLTGGAPNPFHDAAVRRAFALATDKRAIVDKVRRVGEEVAGSVIPPGSIRGFDEGHSIQGLGTDPVRARAELASAGWTDRDGDGVPEDAAGTPFPVVEMLCSTGSYHEKIALAMGAMWEETLGVRTRIVSKESKAYRDDLKRRDYMLARGGWYGDYGDPTTFLSLHATGDGNNDRGFSSARFDGLLAAAEEETDPDKRMRILEDAERLIAEVELPVLPIWRYRQFYQFDADRLHGLSEHPRMQQRLDMIRVSDEPAPGAERAP